ncbi:TadG family pilus assembly protein [Brevundimonas staleyi]|uniref:TadG family pilus assembly protein n=1 Tax=Brevundimonas staleyi TaxID=74326 RepID=A0ABW0FW50_9CAUL
MRRRDLAADERGGVAVLAAAAGGLFCVLAAIVVDLGSLALDGRTLQGAADLAALSAATDLTRAQLAAEATAQANLGLVTTRAVTGLYVADPRVAPHDRFAPAASGPNAVRVTLSQTSPLVFGKWILGKDAVVLTRSATAARTVEPPRALFSIGSRLAALDGGVANSLLSGLTGSTVSLSVMDYNRLADAKVNLLGFTEALATELGVKAGDYDALLARQVDAGTALRVLRDLAGDQADSTLSKLIGPAARATLRVGDLIGAEADAGKGLATGLDASVSVLDLVMALLETGGERQVALDLGAKPRLAALNVSLAIGERPNRSPWITVTGTGSPIVRTAQARLYVKTRTAQALSGLAQVNLPVLIELASSEARLDAIDCRSGAVTLGVRPGLASAKIGEIEENRLGDFKRALTPTPATLLSVLGVVRLTGKADVEIADTGFRAVRFSAAEIADRRLKTATSSSLATGLITTLIQRLDVTVHVLGLGLGLGGIVQALGALLAPLGPVLDGAIHPLLDMLGLKLGQADVRVHGVTCPRAEESRPVLVG